MALRQYTVKEIIRMRLAVQTTAAHAPIPSTPESLEAQLRTYMDNGTAPEELEGVAAEMTAGPGIASASP